MERSEFKLLTSFHTDDPVIDKWTHVFSERNPYNGCSTMLATNETGFGFSQWCEGTYAPEGDNAHLGNETCLRPGGALFRHVMQRIAE